MTNNLVMIKTLQTDLKTFGLSWPEEILAQPELPTIPEPTEQDFVDAVLAAKGEPANDPTVQTLVHRMALIRFGHVNTVIQTHAERKRNALIPAAIDELTTKLQELHAKEVNTLAEAQSALNSPHHIRDIRLEGLAPHLYETVAHSLTAQHRAERIRRVWGKLHALKGLNVMNPNRGGYRARLYILANPTPAQYKEALNDTSTGFGFPEHEDEWGILQHGWEVSLADSESHAFQRLHALMDAAEQTSSFRTDEAEVN